MQQHIYLHKKLYMIFTALLAYILSLLPLHLSSFYLTIGLIPIVILGLNFGVKASLIASLTWGILTLLTGQAEILTPTQAFLEYIVAFTCGGLGGLYNFRKHPHSFTTVFNSLVIATTARYFWHFVAGVIFWRQFMPAHFNPYIYSLLTNGGSCLLTILIDGFILWFLFKQQFSLLK